jgi:DNA-binding transcriptional ArsR family regulator
VQTRSKAQLKESAALFAALGDETRLHLVATLCDEGPSSISKLSEGRGITRQAVTKHLEAMKDAGLVNCYRSGREKIWDLSEKRLQVARDYLELTSKRWDGALQRLKRLVEE